MFELCMFVKLLIPYIIAILGLSKFSIEKNALSSILHLTSEAVKHSDLEDKTFIIFNCLYIWLPSLIDVGSAKVTTKPLSTVIKTIVSYAGTTL